MKYVFLLAVRFTTLRNFYSSKNEQNDMDDVKFCHVSMEIFL